MSLARFDRPFEHPDWIFEPKMDGFRAVAYVEGGTCRLVSRNHNAFKTFAPQAQAMGQDLSGRAAILDGEIVRPGPDGRPLFYELMRRRGPFCFCAFDLLWLVASDLRDRPLAERKRLLRELVPRPVASGSVHGARRERYGSVPRDLRAGHGRDRRKQASASYTPDATTWVKIKNGTYGQAIGREDFFDRRRAAA
jgi:bifunctional non-homologous end joining protein LigD